MASIMAKLGLPASGSMTMTTAEFQKFLKTHKINGLKSSHAEGNDLTFNVTEDWSLSQVLPAPAPAHLQNLGIMAKLGLPASGSLTMTEAQFQHFLKSHKINGLVSSHVKGNDLTFNVSKDWSLGEVAPAMILI